MGRGAAEHGTVQGRELTCPAQELFNGLCALEGGREPVAEVRERGELFCIERGRPNENQAPGRALNEKGREPNLGHPEPPPRRLEVRPGVRREVGQTGLEKAFCVPFMPWASSQKQLGGVGQGGERKGLRSVLLRAGNGVCQKVAGKQAEGEEGHALGL